MPIPTSYPDIFSDWRSLAAAIREQMAAMPELAPHERELTQVLEEAEALKSAQEQYEGLRQATTQKLHAKIAEGREAVIRARRMIGARLGPRNEVSSNSASSPSASGAAGPGKGGPQKRAAPDTLMLR